MKTLNFTACVQCGGRRNLLGTDDTSHNRLFDPFSQIIFNRGPFIPEAPPQHVAVLLDAALENAAISDMIKNSNRYL